MLTDYLYWQFGESPKRLFDIYRKMFAYFWNLLSIELLLKTLFYPWKRDTKYAEAAGGLNAFFDTIWSNFISRSVGFMVRSLTIIAEMFFIGILIIIGIIIFLVWVAFPLVVLWSLFETYIYIF